MMTKEQEEKFDKLTKLIDDLTKQYEWLHNKIKELTVERMQLIVEEFDEFN